MNGKRSCMFDCMPMQGWQIKEVVEFIRPRVIRAVLVILNTSNQIMFSAYRSIVASSKNLNFILFRSFDL